MTIQELADRSNVTVRTIRYYVEQGVLPPPERGRPAEYTERHVYLLDLIRRLKEQYLPLEEIRDMMGRLSVEQIEELLAHPVEKPREEAEPASSAAEYIASVLNRGAAREQIKQQAVASPSPTLAMTQAMPEPHIQQASEAARRSAVGPHSLTTPTGKADTLREEAAYISDASTWKRITLAPGIEINYIATDDARINEIVDRLVHAYGHMLEENPAIQGEQ